MSNNELRLQIKNEILISIVIGNYLSIKNEGHYKVALCPFHSDSKPSLLIDDSSKIFKCLTCDETGDAISFVMKYRSLNFIESLKEIADNVDINFESYQNKES